MAICKEKTTLALVSFFQKFTWHFLSRTMGARHIKMRTHSQSEIAFEGIGYTHKDANTSLRMNGRGAILTLSPRLWNEMEADGRYSLLGAAPSPNGAFHYSWGFFRVKDVSFSLPGNDKAITVVDGRNTSDMSCEGVQISTDAPFGDDSRVNPKCIGIRTCCGGNNGRRYALEF